MSYMKRVQVAQAALLSGPASECGASGSGNPIRAMPASGLSLTRQTPSRGLLDHQQGRVCEPVFRSPILQLQFFDVPITTACSGLAGCLLLRRGQPSSTCQTPASAALAQLLRTRPMQGYVFAASAEYKNELTTGRLPLAAEGTNNAESDSGTRKSPCYFFQQ
jgi:hypothetical protein